MGRLAVVLICVTIILVAFDTLTLADFCPDHKIRCRKGQTCCDDGRSSFGCCPYENATCCADHRHCCPSGLDCDVKQGRCQKRTPPNLLDLLNSRDAENEIQVEEKPKKSTLRAKIVQMIDRLTGHKERITCPDQKQKCPTQYTCCELPLGKGYGCCPFANAVCCKDQVHCCPKGSSCDIKGGRCI